MLKNVNISEQELNAFFKFKSHGLIPGIKFKTVDDARPFKELLYSRGFRNWVPFFVWPGSIHTSSYILTNPSLVKDKFVFDLACGGGVIGITAKKVGAIESICIDKSEISQYLVEQNSAENDVTVQFNKDSILNINDYALPKNSVFFCSEIDFPHQDSKNILTVLNALAKRGYPVYTTHTMRENPPLDFNVFTKGITKFKIIDKQRVQVPSLNMETKFILKTVLVKIIPF